MENIKKTPKVVQAFGGKMNKELLGRIVLVPIGILAAFIIGHKFFNLHESPYMSITAQLETKYGEMRKTQLAEMEALAKKHAHEICLAEKELAKSKLTDILNHVEVTGEPNILKQKLNRDCSVFEEKPQSTVPVAQAAIVYDGKDIEIEKKDYDKYEDQMNKLARAVAIAETANCTKGYGITHNNCFGIKKGNTYPCSTKPNSKMCNFSSKEESFKAFKIIWGKWYKNIPPTRADAIVWTGNDRPDNWLKNVYNNL